MTRAPCLAPRGGEAIALFPRRLAALAMAAALVMAQTVAAQSPSASIKSGDVFQDWVIQCAAPAAAAGQDAPPDQAPRCFITQSIHVRESGVRLLQLAAGYPFADAGLMLLLSGPLGIYLPSGFTLRPDEADTYRVEIQYCNREGCHAFLEVTDKLLAQLKRGRWLNVSMRDGTRREVRFQASLNGLTAGLAAVESTRP